MRLRKVEDFLRKNVVLAITANVLIAVFWIPSTIYSFLSPEKKRTPEALPPPPATSLPPPPPRNATSLPNFPEPETESKAEQNAKQKQNGNAEARQEVQKKTVERKEERKQEARKKIVERKQEVEERKQEAQKKIVERKQEVETPPPKGPFGFSCNAQGCFMFDIGSGKRYAKGDSLQGWYIKEITIHGAVLLKDGKEVRVGVE